MNDCNMQFSGFLTQFVLPILSRIEVIDFLAG
jgi:hypothetical protein